MTDAKTFKRSDGLTWRWGADKTRTFNELDEYSGQRAQAGKAVPTGFPKGFPVRLAGNRRTWKICGKTIPYV